MTPMAPVRATFTATASPGSDPADILGAVDCHPRRKTARLPHRLSAKADALNALIERFLLNKKQSPGSVSQTDSGAATLLLTFHLHLTEG